MSQSGIRIPKIGFHAPIKGGVHNALIVAKDTGCDTVQLFSRNPRGWLAKPFSLEDVLLFRRTQSDKNLAGFNSLQLSRKPRFGRRRYARKIAGILSRRS